MKLISLSRLETDNLVKELNDLYAQIKNASDVLQDKEKLMNIIKEELDEVAKKIWGG